MARFTKKVFAWLITIVMTAGILPFSSLAEIDISSWVVKANAKTYSAGDIITFGGYPQSEVTDADNTICKGFGKTVSLGASINKKEHNWNNGCVYGDSATGEPAGTVKTCVDCGEQSFFPNEYYIGEEFQYGSYPQSCVHDAELCDILNQLATEWGHYQNYSVGTSVNYDYCDIEYDGARYRGVRREAYRGNAQDHNEYVLNQTYWFKFEPIIWKLMDEENKTFVSRDLIDAQPFNGSIREKYVSENGSHFYRYYNSSGYGAADYYRSDIRKWLNQTFYGTAFSDVEKTVIATTTVENDVPSSVKLTPAPRATENTVYLLSWNEVVNKGFFKQDDGTTRNADSSDYAKIQGIPAEDDYFVRSRVFSDVNRIVPLVYHASNWIGKNVGCGGNIVAVTAVEGVRPVIAFVTGETESSHYWDNWFDNGDGTHTRICKRSNSHAETADHVWNNGVIIKTPTCKEPGELLFTCTACGAEKTEPVAVDPANHADYGTHIENAREATCGETGYAGDTVCNGCGAVLSAGETLPTVGDHVYLNRYVSIPATYEHEGLEKRDCAYCGHSEERVIPRLHKDTFTATFIADGRTVGEVEFQRGASEIEEPAVPAKDRYTGAWEPYTLGESDLTVNAVYTLIKNGDGETLDSESSAVLYRDTDDVLFKVSASSAAKTVRSVVAKSVPLDIVLVVDQSGSMEDPLGGSVKKVDALRSAAHDFIDAVAQNAALTGAAHRISVVGFGLAGKYSGYQDNENSELLTSGRGVVPFAEITPADYASSLISIADKSVLDAAVDGIEARGATAADLGLEMAKGVFANTDSAGRERVVVFMTDGEPTYTNGFQTAVANSAIANAGLLKKTYGASVYSVGVFDAAQSRNTNIRTFMNAVSSDYPQASSMRSPGARVSDHYYITVNDTAKLSEVFRTITTESLSHTASFDDVTLIKTLSKYVTLTAPQEQTLRVDAIRKYGISNDQITVTRNDDGTTLIRLDGLTPYEVEKDGKICYEVSLEFFASLNENATAAADYTVDGEDSGVMLGGAIGYETTFDTNDITLSENKTRYLFTINGELYEITEGSSVSAAKPETDFAPDWQFSGWNTTGVASANGVIVDATLVKAPRTVVWHTADGDVSQIYTEGEFLEPPTVADRADGSKFLSWNKSLPTVMLDEDLEFTAVYGEHIHRYISSVETKETCERDGVLRFTCVCGDTYTETVPATGHHYESITPSTEQDESRCTFVCTNCGQRYEYALDYQITVQKNWGRSVSYEFQLTDDDLEKGFEPDGAIDIRIPLSEIQSGARSVSVTRTVNGRRETVPAKLENGFLIITADHFTPYDINFIFACEETGEHVDADGDGFCDDCGEQLKTETPTEPTEPSDPTVPVDQDSESENGRCELCGSVHPDTSGGRLVQFIHTIIYLILHLFGVIK